jgi:hypothetical protein
VPFIRWNICENVQARRKLQVGRIEIHQVIRPVRGDLIKQCFSQITMGVYDTDPVSFMNMLNDQIPEESSFAGTSFSQDVNMLTCAFLGDAKDLRITPAGTRADDDGFIVIHDAKTSRHSFHMDDPLVV